MASSRPSDDEVRQRRRDVLGHVIEHGEVRIGELTKRFKVSLMTMHRDLDELAEQRMLHKLRGRVTAYPALTMETATRFREKLNPAGKAALAALAFDQLESGQRVFLDDSTTLFPLARLLTTAPRAPVDLRVLTNSLRIARILAPAEQVEVTLLGGQYRAEFDSCAGPEVLAALEAVGVDLGFVSAAAIAAGRIYHPVPEYAELKLAALRACTRSVLVADQGKFGRTAEHPCGDSGDYHLVITDRETAAGELAALRAPVRTTSGNGSA